MITPASVDAAAGQQSSLMWGRVPLQDDFSASASMSLAYDLWALTVLDL